MTKNKYRSFQSYNQENLRNPEDARAYLDIALEVYDEDADTDAFLLALRDVAEARGGVGKLSEQTSLSRQSLYKALSEKGNPRLDTLGAILHGLGFRLAVEPL